MKIGRAGLVVIIGVLSLSTLLPGQDRSVRVIRSEPRGITLEIRLPSYRFEPAIVGDRRDREIRIDGWGTAGEIGDPDLPATGALIEVPSDGRVRLAILSAAYESLFGCEIRPVPRSPSADPDEPLGGIVPKSAAYSRNSFFPGPLAHLSEILRMRSIPVARVFFCPFQWNPATGELRIYRTITVRADFDEPLPEGPFAEADDVFAGPAQMTILNRSPLPASPPLKRILRSDSGVPYQNRLRLEIEETGLYRLDETEVAASGLNPASLNPASFRLYCQNREIAFAFHGRSGNAWGPGEYLEFYGERIDSEFTKTNVYWLTWESGPGISFSNRIVTAAGTGERTTTFRDTVRLEENLVPWFQAPEAYAVDHWFWTKMTAPADATIPFNLPDDILVDGSTARLRVYFQGRSTAPPHPNHRTQLTLNEVLISDIRWDNDQVFIQTAELPQTTLRAGANLLRLDMPRVSTGDVCYFNWAALEYRRGLNARKNEILFSPENPGFKSFEIGGFSSPDIRIYDLSEPGRPVRLTGFSVVDAGGSFGARFDAAVGESERFYVLAADRIRRPSRVDYVEAGTLALDSNRADLILIAPRALQAAAAPLLAAQAARRLRPRFVAVEDVFDEFGAGIPDPAAIKAFLQTAYDGWQRPAPLYVLLMGDATYDYRDHLGLGKENQVPAHFSWMSDTGLTADDNWFACVDGEDGLPDLLLGRIPGGTPETALKTAMKLAAMEMRRTAPPKTVILAADDGDDQFVSMSDQIVPLLPPGYAAQKIYLGDYADKNQASLDLLAAINSGAFLVHFAGHGNVTLWAGERILDNAKVDDLRNADHLALFCAYTCNNGFFPNAPDDCMAETLIKAEDKGAFAFLASTSSGLAWIHEIMALATARSLFRIRSTSLGAIFVEAKLDAFARGAGLDELAKFTLFGDPSQRIEIR